MNANEITETLYRIHTTDGNRYVFARSVSMARRTYLRAIEGPRNAAGFMTTAGPEIVLVPVDTGWTCWSQVAEYEGL